MQHLLLIRTGSPLELGKKVDAGMPAWEASPDLQLIGYSLYVEDSSGRRCVKFVLQLAVALVPVTWVGFSFTEPTQASASAQTDLAASCWSWAIQKLVDAVRRRLARLLHISSLLQATA